MSRISIFILSLCVFIASSCAQDKKETVVTIKTNYGDMIAILYDDAPKHKANFIKLANSHFYDSTLFHRVIQGFMIQGGDPESKKAKSGQGLGGGSPGYTIDAEIIPKYFHEKGTLSAARLGDMENPKKASSGSQFYVVQGRIIPEEEMSIDQTKYDRALKTFFENPKNKGAYDSIGAAYQSGDDVLFRKVFIGLRPRVEKETGMDVSQKLPEDKVKAYSTVGGAPMLDGNYTIFGKVIAGLDVIDKIATVEKDQRDRPVQDIRMKVSVEEMTRGKIKKLYGYVYP
ncbi:MAG: peptidylprolyl isomerase [Chryseolinea sp.]